MYKQKYTYLYIIFFTFCCLVSQAQQYRFSIYSLEEGLPQSEVMDILQDKRGSIWVGTNGGGVARFNGITFRSFNEKSSMKISKAIYGSFQKEVLPNMMEKVLGTIQKLKVLAMV
jgi:ligand-binding sensor domain-containing protein